MKIAQKFGERTLIKKINGNVVAELELHDCGEVYRPDHNYLLCIMTRGNNFTKMANAIKDISKTVYDFVDGGNI